MKNEIRIFFTALMFYTRIPCPKIKNYSSDYINKASRYFPLIGWIVGGISFLFYYASSLIFDINVSVFISLIVGVLITGAFHEDGLADAFDGFGGGWTKEKILEIMKDSRIGTFGVIALIFIFALKFFGLQKLFLINNSKLLNIALIFISYHSLARLTAVNIIFTSTYSRDNETSKVKPIAKTSSYKEIICAYFFGLIPFILLCFINWKYCLIIIPLIVLYLYCKHYFEKWIDGYTGDCLGAVEQAAECVVILGCLVIWKFM